MASQPKFDREFDIVMVGETGVGKTCFVNRFVFEAFHHRHRATVGMELSSRIWEKDGRLMKVNMWDTPGLHSQHAMLPNFFRRAHGFILVYDVTNQTSFLKLHSWLDKILMYGQLSAITFLVGSKFDLVSSHQVESREVVRFCHIHHLRSFETSSLTGAGVAETFSYVLRSLEEQPQRIPSQVVLLGQEEEEQEDEEDEEECPLTPVRLLDEEEEEETRPCHRCCGWLLRCPPLHSLDLL